MYDVTGQMLTIAGVYNYLRKASTRLRNHDARAKALRG